MIEDRHRRIKKQRRHERLAATSQLSCGNFSDTSTDVSRLKWIDRPCFTVCIHNENQNQVSFSPFGLRISVLTELTLGHLRYHLTDVPPSKLPQLTKSPARISPRKNFDNKSADLDFSITE